MATKLEYYAFNPLATTQISLSFAGHQVDDWEYLHNFRLKKSLKSTQPEKLKDPMDRMLEKQNVESIKKTMQMHEDVFKHQVRELHRLYNVQKMLMDELKKKVKQHSIWNPMMTASNKNHPTVQTNCGYNNNMNIQSLRDDPTTRERSGSCSGDTIRMRRGFNLERPADEDISTGVSAIDEDQAGPSSNTILPSSNTILTCDEDNEVELTLSIGGSMSKKKSKKQQRELDSSASFKLGRGGECSDPTTTTTAAGTAMSSSGGTFDQDEKRPHWLFQSLNINRT